MLFIAIMLSIVGLSHNFVVRIIPDGLLCLLSEGMRENRRSMNMVAEEKKKKETVDRGNRVD